MVEDELLGYDDTASVAFIRNYIPQELKELLSDDDIVYFVDLIYDYYESRGYLSDDDADDEEPIEIDEDELVDYVVRNAQKDGVGKFDPDQIRFVVQGELGAVAAGPAPPQLHLGVVGRARGLPGRKGRGEVCRGRGGRRPR